MKYFHLRYHFEECKSNVNPNGIDCRGGITIGMESVGDDKVRYAIAFCSLQDVYSRRIGRQIVEGRIKSDNCWEVDVDPTQSWSDIFNIYVTDKIMKYFVDTFDDLEEREQYFEALQ